MSRGIKTGGNLPARAIFDSSQKRTEQEQLEILFNTIITDDDKALRKKYVGGADVNQNKVNKIFTRKSYIKGILDKIILAKDHIGRNTEKTGDNSGGLSLVTRHIDFLAFLGLNAKEIFYTIYTFGYRNITFEKINEYLASIVPRRRINKIKKEFIQEMELLQKDIFQEMSSEVMAQEKKYLEGLLSKLPDLYKELEELDPIMEPTKWNRVNKLITDILEKCKAMHGIELYRENTVKAQAAIAVQNNVNKGDSGQQTLPMPTRHPELEEGKIIVLDQERHIIGKKEEI